MRGTKLRTLGRAVVALALFAGAQHASAVTIYWADWTQAFQGETTGTASATITVPGDTVTVSYTGQVTGNTNVAGTYPSWGPASTFSGGTVGNPPDFLDIIALTGGTSTGTNTITFSTPVVNPVMAFWSLGQGGETIQYIFGDEEFNVESGGPSAEFGGQSITEEPGNIVQGIEGNGTVQFIGTFSKIDWTVPNFENWHGFTLGIAGEAGPSVPEPGTLVLLAIALIGFRLMRKRRID
jgi:PEP-CTERM motif